VAVLGGESMGKTSLLKLLCGLEKQYVGFINFDGVDIKEIKEEERGISYLPSEPVFLASKSLKDNLNYLFEVQKIEPLSDEKILEIFDKFSFKKSLYDKVKRLSLFEKRVFAIIRSYIKNPRVVIIDEQTEGLGLEDVDLIKNAISMLINDKNTPKTAIMVCDDADLTSLADKYFYISYGRLYEVRKLEDVAKNMFDAYVLNYFNYKQKLLMLTKEENNYYLNDYKFEYKNPKNKKGKTVVLFNKIKLDNSFNSVFDKTGIFEGETLEVLMVSKDEFSLENDRVVNDLFISKQANLFESGTGVKII
ncbi:MAG: ATP-binding cassette domain-containing protein, partial [Clostridia bacterium]|nr:ATP-binding cassette domain-containing protein [Clostridia bacterium]